MLDAAYDLFCTHGFRATTMEAIADQAGVAVQTLYFSFHTKDELLQAVQDRAVMGDEQIPPEEQAWFSEMREAVDVETAVRVFGENVAAILARVAPLLPTFHAVAGDPAGEVWRHSETLRRSGYADIVKIWSTKCKRRPGLSQQRAVDRLFVYAGPEVYRSFVIDCGWRRQEYVDWLVDSVLHELYSQTRSWRT